MFKAIRTTDNAEIIILDPDWEDALDTLRKLGRADLLVCQECRQTVRVRAGLIRRPYFAHKQRRDCPYQTESPALLQARATLYKWLVGKFGADQVQIEQKIADADLPRPVDCWVTGIGVPLGYWITDSGIQAQTRAAIKVGFEHGNARLQWLGTASMLREVEDDDQQIMLSTTERDMLTASRYDEMYAPAWQRAGPTLHYLNGETAELITFRNLQLVHAPHTFAGIRHTTPLRDMLVSPKTGEFVHPGEHEVWEEYRAYQADKAPPPALRPLSIPTRPLAPTLLYSWQHPRSKAEQMPESIRAGTCSFCGQLTTDWWSFDGATAQCKCRPCRAAGRV